MSNVNTRGVDAAAQSLHETQCACAMDGHWVRWRPDAYQSAAAYLDAIEGESA